MLPLWVSRQERQTYLVARRAVSSSPHLSTDLSLSLHSLCLGSLSAPDFLSCSMKVSQELGKHLIQISFFTALKLVIKSEWFDSCQTKHFQRPAPSCMLSFQERAQSEWSPQWGWSLPGEPCSGGTVIHRWGGQGWDEKSTQGVPTLCKQLFHMNIMQLAADNSPVFLM